MALYGPSSPGITRNNPLASQSSPLKKQYDTYGAAVNTQAGDYDRMMGNYNELYNRIANSSNPGITAPGSYTPQTFNYNQSGDLTSALANSKNLSNTGGYSDSDIANLRERGISPIRSIYSSANNDIDRQRVLQGGFSPNYTAAKTKMAREQSEQIASQMTKVNADIAERVAQNKIAATGQYGQLASGANSLSNEFGFKNTEAQNDASKFNIGNNMEYENLLSGLNMNKNKMALEALQGQNSLYGTTPGLVNTFGNQALQSASLQNTIKQQNNQNRLRQMSMMMG